MSARYTLRGRAISGRVDRDPDGAATHVELDASIEPGADTDAGGDGEDQGVSSSDAGAAANRSQTFRIVPLGDGSTLFVGERNQPGDDPRSHRVFVVRDGRDVWVHLDGRVHVLEHASASAVEAEPGALTAAIPEKVDDVLVVPGAIVSKGDVLLVLSAMKMQLEIKAPHDGRVGDIHFAPGDRVDAGELLLTVETVDEATSS